MFKRIKLKFLQDPHFEELAKEGGSALTLNLLGVGFGYFFTLLITLGYGAGAMGVFALSFTVLQIFSVLGRLGFDTALLRFSAVYVANGERKKIVNIYFFAVVIALLFSLVLSIFLYMYSEYLAVEVFNNYKLEYPLIVAAIGIIPLVLLHINTGCLRGMKKIKTYLLLQDTGLRMMSFILLSFTIVVFNGEIAPFTIYVLSVIILSFASFFVWLKNITLSNKPVFDKTVFEKLIKISFPMLFSSSLFLVMGWADTIMLGMFKSEQDVGVYAVALKVSVLASLTLSAVNSIAAPRFAEFWGKRDLVSLQAFGRKSTRMILVTSLPIFITCFFFPSEVLGLFGEEFKVGAFALILLVLGQLINVASGSVGYILQMTGEEKPFQYTILVAAVINVFLNMLLIPDYGMNGAAVASMLSILFWNLASTYILYYKHNVTIFWY